MKYLVTGGAGFIGSNLVEKLVKEGHDVIVIDNLHTGSLDNLKNVRNKVIMHVSHVSGINEIDSIKNLDGIFHLGMPSSSPMYLKDPLLVGQAIKDFTSMLELARRENCKMVFASTSSIYNGNPTPWKEDMPIHVSDFYSEARYAMERLSKFYFNHYQVSSLGMRFFSVYGPKEEAKGGYANLITQFAWEMKRGEQPVIYGDGRQKRDFTFVQDIVDALAMAMNSSLRNDVFNVGTGEAYDLNEMVAILNEHFGTSIEPKYVENKIKNYVPNTLADTTKAHKVLGFKARHSLKDGIRKYL